MYFGAEAAKEPAKKDSSWTPTDWASVITPVGNVIGNIFGKPAGAPTVVVEQSSVNWPLIAVAGFGVLTLGGVILAKKKRR